MDGVFTYETYKLVKRIINKPGKDEKYYEKWYRPATSKKKFDKAMAAGFVRYKIKGYKPIDNGHVIGILHENSTIWEVTKKGNDAYDSYREQRRLTFSNRRFAIIVSLLGAVLSFAGSVIFFLLSETSG